MGRRGRSAAGGTPERCLTEERTVELGVVVSRPRRDDDVERLVRLHGRPMGRCTGTTSADLSCGATTAAWDVSLTRA